MQPERYIFPAVFTFYESKHIGITFPDLPGCVSTGNDIQEAMFMAQDALGTHLCGMEEDNDEIPEPSDYIALKSALHENQIITPVDVYMPKFREANNNKAVNKMCTLPQWLITAGKDAGLNFSQTLQDALMQKLGIKREIKRRKYKH